MIEQIIFLARWPISLSDTQRIDFDYLNRSGFRVSVFVLSQLLGEGPLTAISTSSTDAFTSRQFGSFQELEKEIQKAAPTGLFIDYVMDFTLPMARILRRLKKHGARYFALDGGSVPCTNTPPLQTADDLIRWVKTKTTKLFRPDLLLGFLSRRFLSLLTKLFRYYPCPDKILSVGSEILEVYLRRYNAGPERIVPIPSHDYGLYIKHLKNNGHQKSSEEKIAVFLDVAATHHPDFGVARLKPFDRDQYSSSMNAFFDALERKTGLRVVIASHPHAQYEKYPGMFGGREIVKGKTIELVEKSSLVISHYSTSISFAVLFKKPILVVKTSEMQAHDLYSVAIDQIAASLGLKAVTLDGSPSVDAIDFNYHDWPRNFDDYRRKYITPPGTGDSTAWEIVVREIKKLSCSGN